MVFRVDARVPNPWVVAVSLAMFRAVQLVIGDDAADSLVQRSHQARPWFHHEDDLVALRLHGTALELVQAVHAVLGELGHGAEGGQGGGEERVHDERLSPRARVQRGEDGVARGGTRGLEVDGGIAEIRRRHSRTQSKPRRDEARSPESRVRAPLVLMLVVGVGALLYHAHRLLLGGMRY